MPLDTKKTTSTVPKQGLGREIAEINLLFDISNTLDMSIDLKDVLGPVLAKMAHHMSMLRGTITILDRKTGEIFVEEAYGLSESQKDRGRYKIGEGVTGMVVRTGKPAVVPRISREPLFLDRTGARNGPQKEDVSFICVPIILENDVIGTLSADRLFDEAVSYNEDIRLLSIIASMISQAVNLRQSAQEIIEENIRLKEELKDRYRPNNIIGNSKAMREVYQHIAQVAATSTTVLIRGQSGTGKELVAHAIHAESDRADKPFIKVNCAALPEGVIESELFGHEKGAFTGANQTKKGRFELAHGGTIFLDEVGDLTPAVQIKLLRVIQEREFERVGGMKTISTDVRIIAATHRDLEELIARDRFREDLYFRLNVFPIHLPPLRERPADILLLADHFVEKYSTRHHKRIRRISTPAIDMMMAYHWPGNVRELENTIERAVLLSSDGVIHGRSLPPTLQTAEASGTQPHGGLTNAVDAFERDMIMDALKSARGNRAEAARILGISERLMGLRVVKHEIDPSRFRTKR
ncbi:MAG: sigma 54-interacting transcriptional regulator [Deltaproteobacteria bacterium]|nr:sigma 54-interacting transcriptional regulator [Candidatus Zymogenaceae bacterium]